MFKDKDDAEAWAQDLLRKYGIPNPEYVKGDKESIIPIDSFNNKSQKHRNIIVLDEDDGYHD
tara:strand:- start:3757 stop:3942 length:186 start_codon:yes stop_codon:yes gene_type:complete